VARVVSGLLCADDALFVASSMPVRDVEWYGDPAMACRVLANRGANGIDGLVSTALGAAAGSGGPVVALLGDLAFLHDGGGLLGAARRGVDCCFVVVDNDGGGIFSFLPQAELPGQQFERLWGTPHGVDLTALAAVHGIPAVTATTVAEVARGVGDARREGGVRVVLVRTDRAANVSVHAALNAAVARALATS
jgi:2-succinyl-5-enolpyruvyl-6-hydroxy-3-cyclohexene-1-carboxylate synthase